MVREYRSGDFAALRRMHESMGLDYDPPDLSDPLVLTKLVVEDEDGNVIMAAFLRVTSEAYLLLDHEASDPRGRWRLLQSLHEAVRQDASRKGLNDAQAFVHPHVARHFAKRLRKLGWQRSAWEPWVRYVAEETK